jgi:hypothetical protein
MEAVVVVVCDKIKQLLPQKTVQWHDGSLTKKSFGFIIYFLCE